MCIVDVKRKSKRKKKKKQKRKRKKEKKKKKKKYNNKCVFVLFFFYYYVIKNKKSKKENKKTKNAYLCLFQGSLAKHKEGFNILIGSRCRSTNLCESCISKFRRKDKIFKTSLTHHNHEAAYLR